MIQFLSDCFHVVAVTGIIFVCLTCLWLLFQILIGINTIFNMVQRLVKRQQEEEERIMATLDDVVAKVAAEKTIIDSVKSLVVGLAQQVRDLKDQVIDPDAQAKIDALADSIDLSVATLQDAVVAGTTP